MKKIAIIGMTGSGKTTLAQVLSSHLHIPVHHIDLIFWKDKGAIKDHIFVEEQEKIMQSDSWIIDGGFPRSKSLELRIKNADTVIFYDLPLVVIFWRQLKRYCKYHNKVRPDLGNKQNFPFTWTEIKYALNYPRADIYKILERYTDARTVIIINSLKKEKEFLKSI